MKKLIRSLRQAADFIEKNPDHYRWGIGMSADPLKERCCPLCLTAYFLSPNRPNFRKYWVYWEIRDYLYNRGIAQEISCRVLGISFESFTESAKLAVRVTRHMADRLEDKDFVRSTIATYGLGKVLQDRSQS